jgi:glutamate carboxypeptidase
VEFDAAASRGTAFGKNNVLAEHVVVTGDLRALTEEQFRRAKDAMGAIVGASLPHARATIEFDESYPPLAPGEGNEELLAMYDRVSRDLGFGPVTATNPDEAGAADVSFLSQEVPRILDAIGLKGTGGHTVEETADLETLPIQTKRATLLLHRLSQLTKK